MRAAVFLGPGQIEVRELPDPEPGPGEIVVDVRLCGICGSDLMGWYTARKAPAVLGHEPVGVVSALGPPLAGVSQPPPGTRVFVHHHVPCGVCEHCLAGRETLCSRFKQTRLEPGGFAERVLVSAEHVAKDVLALPDHLSDEAATLIEPLGCCVRGLRRAGVRPRDAVVVVGLGQIGQLYVQAALAEGADVIGVDLVTERRALAAAAGATMTESSAEAIRAALTDRVPRLVAVCSSARPAIALGFDAAGPGSIVQLFAPLAPGETVPVEPYRIFFEEVTVQGTYSAGPGDTRTALDLLTRGMVRADGLITHRFPLDKLGEALVAAKSAPGVLKVVVQP